MARLKSFFKLPLLLSFLLGATAGGALVWFGDEYDLLPGRYIPKGAEIRSAGFKFISPLLECEVTEDRLTVNELRPFKHRVAELVEDKLKDKKASHISVYFRDLNNGPWFGINEKDEFSPASLLKVPIMMTYMKLSETNPSILNKMIKFDRGYDLNLLENIAATERIMKGKSYTVDELLYRMIVYSDNNAKQLLLENIDFALFSKPYYDLGLSFPDVGRPDDNMSVKTYASFFRILFNASYLSKENSEKVLEYLSNSEFTAGLSEGVPREIVVAHKFGERRIVNSSGDIKQLHDCGIVYYPGRPYLLCIMTRGNDFKDLVGNIKDISYFVYEEIEHQQASISSRIP